MSKKQQKKLQHQKLIDHYDELETKKLCKQLMQNAQKCQQDVNICKKQQINADNSLKMIEEIKKSLATKDQSYFNLLNNLDITPESFQEVITKGLPEEIVDIKLEQGPSHFLIGRPEKKLFSSHQNSLKELIENSSFLWKSLKLQFEMTEENREKLIEKFLFNLKNVDDNLFNHFQHKVSKNMKYNELKRLFIKEYTGGIYGSINQVLVTSDPIKLSAMSQYVNIAIKAYEDGDVGQVFQSNQKVYRNFKLPKDLLSLYQLNSYIYFTNMTSTSTQDLSGFGGSDQNNYAAKLIIKLLDLQKQKQNKLYTGLNVKDLSYYPNEDEVLILPYQFFQIKKVISAGNNSFNFELEEIDNKQILNEIRTPSISNVSKNHKPVDKKIFLNILEKSSQIIEEKKELSVNLMEKKIDQYKKETVEFIKKNQITDVKMDNQVILDNNITACVKENTQSSIQKEKNQNNSSVNTSSIYQKPQEIKILDNTKKTPQQDKNVGINIIFPTQTTTTKVVDSLLPNDKKTVPKLDLTKKVDILQKVQNFDQFVENLVQNEEKGKIEEVLKDYILKDLENEISTDEIKEQQTKSKQQEQTIVQKINEQPNYLKSLNIQDQQVFDKYDFLLTLISKSYSLINQQTLFQDTIPSCLKDKFIQRLTIQQSNNMFHKVYFQIKNKSILITDLKKSLQKNFDDQFKQEKGNFLDFTCLNETIIQDNKNIECMCFIFQTNKCLKEVLPIVKTLEIDVINIKSEQQYSYFQLCKDFFAYQGNKNYLINHFPDEMRGNLTYYFPNRTVRLGLNVWGKFDNKNNQWLGMNNGPGEWSVVYTWISEIPLCTLTQGNIPNENNLCQEQFINQNSLQVSQCFDLLASKINPITIGNQKFVIGYQCRAKSSEVQLNSKYPRVAFLDRSKKDIIRPYGVIIKQVD